MLSLRHWKYYLRLTNTDNVLAKQGAAILVSVARTKHFVSVVLAYNIIKIHFDNRNYKECVFPANWPA